MLAHLGTGIGHGAYCPGMNALLDTISTAGYGPGTSYGIFHPSSSWLREALWISKYGQIDTWPYLLISSMCY